jgi:hypothetical protein
MCNLAAIIALTRAMRDTTGNLPILPGIFPDTKAPVVANKPLQQFPPKMNFQPLRKKQ